MGEPFDVIGLTSIIQNIQQIQLLIGSYTSRADYFLLLRVLPNLRHFYGNELREGAEGYRFEALNPLLAGLVRPLGLNMVTLFLVIY